MNNLKSISNLLFLTTLFCSVTGISVIRNKKKTIDDLLSKKDVNLYLDSLERLVDFYTRHKFYVDLSSAFGLFMADVSLRNHLQQEQYDIPEKIRARLVKLLLEIGTLSDYFHLMVQQIKPEMKEERKTMWDLEMSQLFYNKTTWGRAPDKFNEGLLKHRVTYSQAQLTERFGKWKDYVNEVSKPAKLDDCLSMLARNLPTESPKRCDLPPRCNKRVGEGTDVGFNVSHWVFIMFMARFSRQCFVFSEIEDKYELDEYCAKYFYEVQYIACNDFKLPIVASHHCALCGMLGHAQFFRKFWQKKLTQFQTAEGCFSNLIRVEKFEDSQSSEGQDNEWKMSNQIIMNGECDAHFTSVSLVTLSNALRFIIETYY